MALIGGLEAPPGRIMGHAGAWTAPGEPGATAKYQALERVGVTMVNHPEKFGDGMKTLLSRRQSTVSSGSHIHIIPEAYEDSPIPAPPTKNAASIP